MLVYALIPSIIFAETATFNNPIKTDSIQKLLIAILNIIITVLTPFVIVFLVLAGFKYVTGRGNPQVIAEANRALLYGLIGGVVILGAVVITQIIAGVVVKFK